MDLKAHARYELENARRMTEGMLLSFESADDWFYQAHPKANHALWIVAHLALADNAFLSRFRPESGHKPEGWDDLFWFGSSLHDRSAYPSANDVLAYFRDRRRTLLEVFEQLTDEELAAPAPAPEERSPIAGAPCMGHLFIFAARHEGIHSGQLSVAHRGLGHDPLFQPESSNDEAGI